MKVCDIPLFEVFTDCDGGGGTSLTGSVAQPCVQEVKPPDPSMPEPGAGLLFGSAVLAMAVMRKLGR